MFQVMRVDIPIKAEMTTPLISPPLPLPTVPVIELQPQPVFFPPSTMDFAAPVSMEVSEELHEHLAVSDQSRKRCASELEEHRTVKALKKEPQDEVLPTLPSMGAAHDLGVSGFTQAIAPLSLASPHSLPYTESRPPSRPATPVKFSSRGSFSSIKQSPISSIYSPFAPNNSNDFNNALPTNVPTSPTFPGMHTSWSDPVVPSRHHHSLSAGSLAGIMPLVVPTVNGNMMDNFPSPTVPLPPLPTSHTAISPPVGRMSRSGSITGTFPNPYGFGYIDTPAAWTNNTSRLPGQTMSPAAQPWFEGAVASNANTAPPSTAPNTTHNSPTDDDNDDEDDDSDNESNFSKSANHVSLTCVLHTF